MINPYMRPYLVLWYFDPLVMTISLRTNREGAVVGRRTWLVRKWRSTPVPYRERAVPERMRRGFLPYATPWQHNSETVDKSLCFVHHGSSLIGVNWSNWPSSLERMRDGILDFNMPSLGNTNITKVLFILTSLDVGLHILSYVVDTILSRGHEYIHYSHSNSASYRPITFNEWDVL